MLALAIEKHGGACGFRKKLDKCEDMAQKRAAKNNGAPKKRRRAQWLIVDTESDDDDEARWMTRSFFRDPYDSFDEYEDAYDIW